ncbi:MAG: hypothetical protein R6U52_06045 [Kosmotogaceae bacterium]
MKLGAIVAIFLGVLIILSGVDMIDISFWLIVELIFAAAFLNNGIKVFRDFTGEHLGSLIFSGVLIIDAFKLWGIEWSFWQLILALIGSYLVGWGIATTFKNTRFAKSRIKTTRQNLSISRPLEFEKQKLDIDTNLTKVLLLDSKKENVGIESNLSFDKKNFSGNLQYDMKNKEAVTTAKCKARAGVSSVLSKSRLDIELSRKAFLDLTAHLDATDVVLDFSNLRLENAKITTNLSRISLVPSKVHDSRIDIGCEVSSLTLRVPSEVSVTIHHEGELNWSNFDNMIPREDSYVSKNISTAQHNCQLFIKSDMSKLSIEWI